MKKNNIIQSLLIMLLISTPAYTQDFTFPQTTVGDIAKAWFSAYHSENDEPMRDFTAKYRTANALKRMSVDDRMAQHKQIKGMIKRLAPKKITLNTEKSLSILVYAGSIETWFETTFTISETEENKLESFALQPAQAPSEEGSEGFGDWEDLAGLLQNVVDQHKIPGISMAIIEEGKLVESAVAGVRAVGGSEAVMIDDRFHIGSITKSMTATLIGRLIQEKKLKPGSTLSQIFPDMSMLPVYDHVTITQLTQHTAGIPAYLTVTDEEEDRLLALPGNATAQRLAFVKQVLNEEPISEPGASFAYSNAGYSILGAISEKLTGMSWRDQMQEYIFNPLGMKTAGIDWPKTNERPSEPSGHFGALSSLTVQKVDEYELGAYIEPAGDVHVSMEDLARFALAHLKGLRGENGILNSETFTWLHTPQEGRSYAAGWFVTESESGKTVHQHAGSAGTFLALMMIEPESNKAWVMAANAGGVAVDGIFRRVIEAYNNR